MILINNREILYLILIYQKEKIKSFSEQTDIPFELCKKILITNSISLRKLRKIIEVLKTDIDHGWMTYVPQMTQKVFSDDYSLNHMWEDKVAMKAVLQKGYYSDYVNGIFESFKNYNDRVEYFINKYHPKNKVYSTTEAIECLMRFTYSNSEYYIQPFINISCLIKNELPNFVFGENVLEAIKDFKAKYNRFITEDFDVDSLTDNEKKVLFTIKEYGVPISKNHISKAMIAEIVNNLKEKFSTFDVVKTIKELSEKSQYYKESFLLIYEKYFS